MLQDNFCQFSDASARYEAYNLNYSFSIFQYFSSITSEITIGKLLYKMSMKSCYLLGNKEDEKTWQVRILKNK